MAFPPPIEGDGRQPLSIAPAIERSVFCVECGREGPTTDGLCATCFAKRHPLLEARAHLDVSRCARCGSLRFREGWIRSRLDEAIPRILHEDIPIRWPYEAATFDYVMKPEDTSNLRLEVTATGRYGDLRQVQTFRTRLRLRPSLCDVCTKQRSRYYAGIVQVRAETRVLTRPEKQRVRAFVEARMGRRAEGSEDFVSRIEDVRGGLDFYVSTNTLAKSLGRDLAKAFGGTATSTSKLYGRRGGKDLHRVTSLVCLGPFQVGDVVRHKGSLAEVVDVGPITMLRDLGSGEVRRFRSRDLRTAVAVEAERLEATLEPAGNGTLVAVDPRTGFRQPVRSSPRAGPGRTVVVWTPEGAYVSSLPAGSSKG